MLRRWQIECSNNALEKYRSGQSHFFCQATPGAGKTVLAATVAKRLLSEGLIDLVLCFSPSLTVSEGIKRTFSNVIQKPLNGTMVCIGRSLTYQSLLNQNDDLWLALRERKVFVVFDEIHHCSGAEMEQANVWGQKILAQIQSLATFTLAMSGTPWRSDSLPIVMCRYTDPDGHLLVDYQYSLKQAIKDNVCRKPKIVLVDNDHLSVTTGERVESFSSIAELVKRTKSSYQSIIHNDEAMEHLLKLGCTKLAEIRCFLPEAGGLVVASSVHHAEKIKGILSRKYAQSVSIVTYRHHEPLLEIEHFRNSNTQWIVSVGMISEGTDIPRLQVCCHMSSVKTELYFRQVLGRILRANQSKNQHAWLFTFAEESLVSFAERIEQDIPGTCMFAKFKEPVDIEWQSVEYANSSNDSSQKTIQQQTTLGWSESAITDMSPDQSAYELDQIQLGNFKQRIIEAFMAV